MNIKPLQLKNLAKKHEPNTVWPQEARVQAVSQYLVLGNMALVSGITGIPHQLLRAWKRQPWWNEITEQVRATENLQMDNKLSKIVDRSLDAVLDRLENGEFVYNQKTGQVIRRQVNMKDAAKVSVDLITKRELLRGNATERKETSQISVADQLKELALEFAKWSSPTLQQTKPVIELEILEDQNAIHEERSESTREDQLYESDEDGTVSLHEGEESSLLSEESGDLDSEEEDT